MAPISVKERGKCHTVFEHKYTLYQLSKKIPPKIVNLRELRVEERRTVVDDKGEQTTVTRSVDGQTVRQTTIQKNDGKQETIEDLINMDENDKQKFEERWRGGQSNNGCMPVLPQDDQLKQNPGNPSIFRRVFDGLFFPGSRKS